MFRPACIGLTLFAVCIIAYGVIAACVGSDKTKETMKITDHPNYESLRTFKKANEIELMRKFGAHGMGIRWRHDTDETNNADEEIVLAVYVSSDRDGESDIPDFIEIENVNVNGDGVVNIPVLTIISPQASFE